MAKFKYIDSQLAGRDTSWASSSQWPTAISSPADWGDRMKFDLSAMPNLTTASPASRRDRRYRQR